MKIKKIRKCWKTCNCLRTIILLVLLMICIFHTHVCVTNTVCHPLIIWGHGVCSIKAVVDTFGGWGRCGVFHKHRRHNWFFCKKRGKSSYLSVCLSVYPLIHSLIVDNNNINHSNLAFFMYYEEIVHWW